MITAEPEVIFNAITNSKEHFSILVAHLGHQVSGRALVGHRCEDRAPVLECAERGQATDVGTSYASVLPVRFAVGGWLLSADRISGSGGPINI